MSDPVQQLKDHAKEGKDLKKRLRYATTRPDVAKYVRDLRRWHRDLQPIEEACGLSLGIGGEYYPTVQEALPVVGPLIDRPLVPNRHGRIYEAQRKMLVVTAAALSRLAIHLANAKPIPPKHPGGRPTKDPPKRIKAIADELYEQKRRGEKRNKEVAIKVVLGRAGLEEGGERFERALGRLKKRKVFERGKNSSSR